ncbi:hypothetical protein LTR62_002756 [Meristemomyces frigidus]|uniref:Uncharacterized protein n=1 Tax=Meristemomyces frigidus TaxID=1508187 RepID=A0AAN7TGN1_9PEZI|nr:hypothetical protein LTR62_002756 [Meristemomyces frigidus]
MATIAAATALLLSAGASASSLLAANETVHICPTVTGSECILMSHGACALLNNDFFRLQALYSEENAFCTLFEQEECDGNTLPFIWYGGASSGYMTGSKDGSYKSLQCKRISDASADVSQTSKSPRAESTPVRQEEDLGTGSYCVNKVDAPAARSDRQCFDASQCNDLSSQFFQSMYTAWPDQNLACIVYSDYGCHDTALTTAWTKWTTLTEPQVAQYKQLGSFACSPSGHAARGAPHLEIRATDGDGIESSDAQLLRPISPASFWIPIPHRTEQGRDLEKFPTQDGHANDNVITLDGEELPRSTQLSPVLIYSDAHGWRLIHKNTSSSRLPTDVKVLCEPEGNGGFLCEDSSENRAESATPASLRLSRSAQNSPVLVYSTMHGWLAYDNATVPDPLPSDMTVLCNQDGETQFRCESVNQKHDNAAALSDPAAPSFARAATMDIPRSGHELTPPGVKPPFPAPPKQPPVAPEAKVHEGRTPTATVTITVFLPTVTPESALLPPSDKSVGFNGGPGPVDLPLEMVNLRKEVATPTTTSTVSVFLPTLSRTTLLTARMPKISCTTLLGGLACGGVEGLLPRGTGDVVPRSTARGTFDGITGFGPGR